MRAPARSAIVEHERPTIALRARIQLPPSLPFVRRPRRLMLCWQNVPSMFKQLNFAKFRNTAPLRRNTKQLPERKKTLLHPTNLETTIVKLLRTHDQRLNNGCVV